MVVKCNIGGTERLIAGWPEFAKWFERSTKRNEVVKCCKDYGFYPE